MKVYNPVNGRLDTAEHAFNPVINRPIRSRDRLHPSIKERLANLFQTVLNAASGNSEPRISQKRDRRGNLYFSVYDPISNESAVMGSEQEIRAWLEQRYSR